jgi:hypothetical protein
MRSVSSGVMLALAAFSQSGCKSSGVNNFTEALAEAKGPYRNALLNAIPNAEVARAYLDNGRCDTMANEAVAKISDNFSDEQNERLRAFYRDECVSVANMRLNM